MNLKIQSLQDKMIENNIDLIYLDSPDDIAYFTNFESDPIERILALIVTQNDNFLFVPSLEKEDAQKESKIEQIYSYSDNDNPWKIITKHTKELTDNIQTIGIDESTLTVERYYNLKKHLFNEGFSKIIDVNPSIEKMRVIKDKDEIDKMNVAGKLTDEAIALGFKALKVGITEQEIAALIDLEMKKRGVTEMSFPTTVLFGDHAASPHGVPGDRKLKMNDIVLIDLGVILNGYASDMTRTVVFGEITNEHEEIYNVVLKAQKEAQKAVRPGIKAGELDQIARKIITDAGYGECFTHRLGHGIGKTAHEFPSIHGDNDTILQPGMCFSIEPGIYIPGQVGIRIEDCVYVTDDGAEPFTHTDKSLVKII